MTPRVSGKTSIRGGYGIFYDMGYGHSPGVAGAGGGPPTTLVPTGFNINGYQNVTPGLFGPPSFSSFPFKLKKPQVQQFNFTIEHEFPGNNILSVAYVGSLSRHLDRSRNINQVPMNAGIMKVPVLAGTPGCDASGNCNVQSILINSQQPNIFFVPFSGYGQIQQLDETATASYNSLQLNFRHSVGHGILFQGTYAWQKAMDDTSDGYNLVGTDDLTNLNRWRSLSDHNRGQVLTLNYVYDLPFFKTSANSLVKNGLGGWEVSGITSFFTGLPVDFSCTKAGFGKGIGTSARCDTLGPLKISKGVTNDPTFGPVVRWFDPNMIAMANLSQYSANGQPGMFGYLGRNVLTGPGRNNWDMALLKNFKLPWVHGENAILQFRFESFNTFNHTQWKRIRAGCSGNTPFGAPCSGPQNISNGEVTSAWDPRQLQVGLKLVF